MRLLFVTREVVTSLRFCFWAYRMPALRRSSTVSVPDASRSAAPTPRSKGASAALEAQRPGSEGTPNSFRSTSRVTVRSALRHWAVLFNAFDVDGNGHISESEFASLLQRAGVHREDAAMQPSTSRMQRWHRAVTLSDKASTISIVDWFSAAIFIVSKSVGSVLPVFRDHESNGTGVLTATSFHDAMADLDFDAAAPEILKRFGTAGVEDGVVRIRIKQVLARLHDERAGTPGQLDLAKNLAYLHRGGPRTESLARDNCPLQRRSHDACIRPRACIDECLMNGLAEGELDVLPVLQVGSHRARASST